MKKIALAFAFCTLALSANSSLNGSILVNTVSFADLPDKPAITPGNVITNQKIKFNSSTCTVKVKTTGTTNNSCQVKTRCVDTIEGN